MTHILDILNQLMCESTTSVHSMRVKKGLAIGSTTRPLAILIEGGLLEALSTSSKENRKIFHLWGDLLYQLYTDCRVRRYRLSKYGPSVFRGLRLKSWDSSFGYLLYFVMNSFYIGMFRHVQIDSNRLR